MAYTATNLIPSFGSLTLRGRAVRLTLVAAAMSMVAACDGGGSTADETPGEDSGETAEPVDPVNACGDLPEADAASWEPGMRSEVDATATDAEISAAGAQSWALSLDLLRAASTTEHPTVAVAPAAFTASMGMTYGRYQGQQCGDRIHEVMGFEAEGDSVHQTLGASLEELRSRSLAPSTASEAGEVLVAFEPSTWSFDADAPSQLDAYGAAAHRISADDPAAAREVINCVVEEQSRGLLTDFLPESLPQTDTTAIDLTVAYLEAPWAVALSDSGEMFFTKDDGDAVQVASIGSSLVSGRMSDDEQFTAMWLPLRGEDLWTMFVMPPEGVDLESFTAEIDAATLLASQDNSIGVELDVQFPALDIPNASIDFYDALGFDCEPFTMRTAIHGAAVQMDAKGIKAAAAAADENWESGGPGFDSARIVLDRPFLFFVYDEDSQHVLYNGRYSGE